MDFVVGSGLYSGGVEERGENIHRDGRAFLHGPGGNFTGPAGEKRHAEAAFGQAEFVAAVRTVGKVGALGTVVIEFGARAVIGGENDEGVLRDLEFVERGEHLADAGVETLDHRGVKGEETAVGEDAPVFLDELERSLERVVRSVEGEVEEERFFGRDIAADELDGFGGELVGVVAFARHGDRRLVVERLFYVPKAGCADEGAPEFVEAVRARPVFLGVTDVPFTDETAAVAGGLQRFGNGDRGVIEREDGDVAAGVGAGEFGHADTMRVAAGHERGAGGRAHRRGGSVVRELHALLGEAVEVRRVDLRAVMTEVSPAEIVGEDHDEIGRALGGGGEGKAERGVENGEAEQRTKAHGF